MLELRHRGAAHFALLFATIGASPTIPNVAAQTITGITNAASFLEDEVAPGSIVTIFGANLASGTAQATGPPWPTVLGGVRVQVSGGAFAPLYYVSPTQISLQVPNDLLAGLPTNRGELRVYGAPCNGDCHSYFVASSSAPGIFTGSGNWGIVQNPDYSLNSASNPAGVGGYVTVYMTGIGKVDNPVAVGTATPDAPLARATAPFSIRAGRRSIMRRGRRTANRR